VPYTLHLRDTAGHQVLQQIPILTYHSLNTRGKSYPENDHVALEQDLLTIKKCGFRVLPLTTLVDHYLAGTLEQISKQRVCAITFDDGVLHDFADFYHPDQGLLKSFARILSDAAEAHLPGWERVPATSFVIASPEARAVLDVACIAGRNQWHDHWWEEAIDHYHFDIGNHSWNHTHPALEEIQAEVGMAGNFFCVDSLEHAEAQILKAEAYLTQKLGDKRSRLFAYPYGHVPEYLRDEFFPAHTEEFKAAIATGGHYFTEASTRWAIPRFVCGEDWKSPQEFDDILKGKGGRRRRATGSDLAPDRVVLESPAATAATPGYAGESGKVAGLAVHQNREISAGISGQGPSPDSRASARPTPFSEEAPSAPPFFIVGCVRSGTTLLRDLLKQQPNLYCPEETHLFRWPHPFGSGDFTHIQQHNETLKAHRQIDGVAEGEYRELLEQATSRRMLQDGYARLFFEAKGVSGGRWFDKTPQNIYGMLLLSAVYPDAKFVHIVRHPLNVVTSLKAGKVMAKHSLQGGINTWLEAVSIANQFAVAWPERIHTMTYEALTADPQGTLTALLAFLDEPVDETRWQLDGIHPEKNRYQNVLTEAEVKAVKAQLGSLMSPFGYA